jgi:hypothetical protein
MKPVHTALGAAIWIEPFGPLRAYKEPPLSIRNGQKAWRDERRRHQWDVARGQAMTIRQETPLRELIASAPGRRTHLPYGSK